MKRQSFYATPAASLVVLLVFCFGILQSCTRLKAPEFPSRLDATNQAVLGDVTIGDDRLRGHKTNEWEVLLDKTWIESLRDVDFHEGNKRAQARILEELKDRDQVALAKVAAEDPNPDARKAAVGKLTNQTALAKLAIEQRGHTRRYSIIDSHWEETKIREAVVERLTDETALTNVVFEDRNPDVRKLAIGRLTNDAVLTNIAVQLSDLATHDFREAWGDSKVIRLALTEKLTNQMTLAKLAEDPSPDVAKAAIGKLIDQSILTKIALGDGIWDIRKAAVQRLTDQTALAKLAVGERDRDVRKAAFDRLTSETLGLLVAESTNEAFRLAGEIRLGRQTWIDAAGRVLRNPNYFGTFLGGIAFVGYDSTIAPAVTTLCHGFIRQAANEHIPRLRELLNTFGNQQLAEDYLNCGQPELAAAGREWASKRGYSINSGYGSARAKWGGR